MISNEEVRKLAALARIHVEESEIEGLREDMNSILDYVGQVKEVAGGLEEDTEIGPLKNVMRRDEDPTNHGAFSKELIAEFPDKEGDYLKVKKIL